LFGLDRGESPWASADALPEAPRPKGAEKYEDEEKKEEEETNGIASTSAPAHQALDDVTNKRQDLPAAAGPGAKGKEAVKTTAKVEGEGSEEGEQGDGVKRDPTTGFEFTCGVLSVDEADGRVLAVVRRCRLTHESLCIGGLTLF
jgi:hypothetical protein